MPLVLYSIALLDDQVELLGTLWMLAGSMSEDTCTAALLAPQKSALLETKLEFEAQVR